ncbi:MAG: FAD-binding oxidoreductase [Bdellovibrionales bacterium]|jgi:glycine/D-amino acid oxidase-like deaminating enzyme|nr:FAD-binding oxidoreductase [Bdellovibrionales bacterium]
MSVSFWNDQFNSHKKTSTSVDVVIIGGGITGLSTAFWLQKEDPSLSIAIVEKHLIGAGASGRNAGFITCGSVEHFSRLVEQYGKERALEIWKFSEENLSLLKEHIINVNKVSCNFEQGGSFSLASTAGELKELNVSAQLMKKLKINVESLNGAEIQQRLGAHNFVGGIKYLDDACVNPVKLLEAIRNQLNSNVKIYENNEVFNISTKSDLRVVQTNQESFESPIVILATNGYSTLINNYFSSKIFPTRGQILVTEALPKFMEGPCYANFVLDYFRQLPTGEVLIGGFRQMQKDTEVGYSDETTEIIQKSLEEFISKYLPITKNKKIKYRWSGIMGFSYDGMPLIGSLPTDHQIFFCGGYTAHGIGLSFNSSKKLVDLIFNRNIPQFLSAKR